MKKIYDQRSKVTDFLPSLGVVLFILTVTWIFAMKSPLNVWKIDGNTSRDSSVFKTVALYMEKGFMPYKDTFDHKGPLLYLLNWFGLKISYWRGTWIFELLSFLFTFIAIYKIAKFSCGRFYSCVSVLIAASLLFTYIDSENMVEEYAMPFIAVSLYFFVDYLKNNKISVIRLILCGTFFGAVCLLRINMIAVWIIFCSAVFFDLIYKKNGKEIFRFLFFFLLGFAAIVLPIMVWLLKNGAFEDFIKDYFLFNFIYCSPEHQASWNNRILSFKEYFNNALVMISLLYSAYLCRKEKSIFHIAYFLGHVLTLFLICLSGMFSAHYGLVLVPYICYSISKIMKEVEKSQKKALCFAALVCVLSGGMIQNYSDGLAASLISFSDRKNAIDYDGIYEVVCCVVDNTEDTDRITVYGNWDIIYAKSKRLSASKYSYQLPLIWYDKRIEEEYFDDLKNNMPKMIVVEPGRDILEMADGKMAAFIDANGYELRFDINRSQIYMQ